MSYTNAYMLSKAQEPSKRRIRVKNQKRTLKKSEIAVQNIAIVIYSFFSLFHVG